MSIHIKPPQDLPLFQTIYEQVKWTSRTYGRIFLIRSFYAQWVLFQRL